MSRRILVPLIALAALLLIATGAIAGVLIADDGGGSSKAPSTSGTGKGYLGLTVSFTGAAGSLRVATVEADGPAMRAGVQVGDVIRSVDGQVVRTPEQLRSAVEAKKPGETVTLTYERSDRERRAEVKLGDAPANARIESPAAPPNQPGSGGPAQGRSRLGVTIQQITPELRQRLSLQRDSGVVITEVAPNSAAASAGLQRGDVILAIGTTQVATVDELQRAVLAAPANQPVDVLVQRGDQQVTLKTSLPPQANLQGLDNLIPPDLRERLQRMIHDGTLPPAQLQQLLHAYQTHSGNVRVGTVKSVNPGFGGGTFILTLAPYAGGDNVTTQLNASTAIRRGRDTVQPGDLKPDELVLVISMDNGPTAFAVYSMGVVNLN